MRRFVSVFKRDKESKQSALARVAPPAPSPSSTLSTPPLSIASDKAHSSASSSSHSASLSTPVDELPASLHSKRSWRTWIGAKRSNSFKRDPPPPAVPDWPPKPDSEDEEEDEDDDYGVPSNPQPPAHAPQNLEILLGNSLVPPLPVSPFVQHSLGPFFPRSSNRPRLLLPPQPDTRTAMFRKHLLARLKRGDLSPAELSSIRPLGHKQPPAVLSTPSFPDSTYPSAPSTKVFPASPGIRRWISRPCFEDRHQIYLLVDDVLQVRPVSAAHAVAALEYSEHLDVYVDPDFDLFLPQTSSSPDAEPTPTLPATLSHAPTQPLSAPLQPQKRNSYTATPSPLRNSSQAQPQVDSEPAAAKSAVTVKRLVRFAEDDSDGDDGLPLHVIRMKKKREQKASFLKQERLKRVKEEEEERRLREHEAQLREQELLEADRRRQAQEKERRDREKAMYADTIASTRLRRETVRAGGSLGSSSNTTSVPSPSSSSLKDAERNSLRPTDSRRFSRVPAGHDGPPSISIPRRDPSDPSLHPHQYLTDSSPGSSRPPSVGYSPVSLNTPALVPGHNSRPPSTYSAHTSSSEDVRLQGGSRRNSVTAAVAAGSGASLRGHPQPMIVSYPTWSGSNPNISTSYIPPIPPFPDYVHDMPLLPPTAPFMKQPYKPRSGPASRNVSPGGASTSSGSRRGSFNSSSERVDRVPTGPPQMTSPRPPPKRQVSANASFPSTHHRQGSSDSRQTSRTHQSTATTKTAPQTPQRPTATTSRSQPALSRGRPLQPQYLQAPSSWMSPPLPTQNSGPIPVFVPVPVQMGMATPYGNMQQMQMQAAMGMQMQAAMGMQMQAAMQSGGLPAPLGLVSPTGNKSAGGSTRSRRTTQAIT